MIGGVILAMRGNALSACAPSAAPTILHRTAKP